MALSLRHSSKLASALLPAFVFACAGASSDPPRQDRIVLEAAPLPPGQTEATSSPAAPSPSTPPGVGSTPAPAAAGTGAALSAPRALEKPKTAAECKAAVAKVPQPSGSYPDVQTQMREFFQAYHESFRCCFDSLWSPQNPGVGGKVALLASIDRNGDLTESDILPSQTTVPSPEVHACILDIAKALVYPKPMHGKAIDYQRNLDFKARR